MCQIGLHKMMRPAVEFGLLDGAPMEALEQQRVLALHMGKEAAAAARMRRGYRKLDERGADRADAAKFRRDRKARSPPDARLRLVDAHGADDLVRRDGKGGERHDWDRDIVDRVAIVARENPLLVAEHLTPQRCRIASFPGLGRELDPVFRGQEDRERIEDHATASRS